MELRRVLFRSAGTEAPDALVAEVRSATGSVKASVMAARALEALRVDATEALRACPVPILFLGGKRDRLLRRDLAREVRALRPDARIEMLDGPHLLLQSRPIGAMRVVSEFLLRCASEHRGQAVSAKDE